MCEHTEERGQESVKKTYILELFSGGVPKRVSRVNDDGSISYFTFTQPRRLTPPDSVYPRVNLLTIATDTQSYKKIESTSKEMEKYTKILQATEDIKTAARNLR